MKFMEVPFKPFEDEISRLQALGAVLSTDLSDQRAMNNMISMNESDGRP